MSVICDVIKQERSPVQIQGTNIFFFLFLKSKNRKIITDRDLYKKKSNTEVSNVKLIDKKNRGLIKWKTFQKA